MSLKVRQSKTKLSEPHHKALWEGKDSGIWEEWASAKKEEVHFRHQNKEEMLCMKELVQQT